jgi:hypothetical protein
MLGARSRRSVAAVEQLAAHRARFRSDLRVTRLVAAPSPAHLGERELQPETRVQIAAHDWSEAEHDPPTSGVQQGRGVAGRG